MRPGGPGGIYVHVPFCGSICSYCHFERTVDHGPAVRADFVSGVLRELDLRRAACSLLSTGRRRATTVYFGGGTPSQLEPALMVRLLEGLRVRVAVAPDAEITAEANPESFSPELAAAWRGAGINRVSLGIQSLHGPALVALGRACDPTTARQALALACRTFERVSADWILGPALTADRLRAELDEAMDLGVGHFSLYLLEVHPGTRLATDLQAGRVTLPADNHLESLYLDMADHLARRGLVQYEVANFARPGQQSRHNGNYWRRRPWLGLGPAAHGSWARRRYQNHPRYGAWWDAVQRGVLPEAVIDPLDVTARRLERAILSLRTCAGMPLAYVPTGLPGLAQGQTEGLWRVVGDRLQLTGRGFLRIDTLEEMIARRLK